MLCDALDRGDLADGLLFIEEIPTALQPALTAWREDGNNASPLPSALEKLITPLDQQMNLTANAPVAKNFTALLNKAKQQQVKVFGIDGGDGDLGVDKGHAGFPERRDVKMNKLAADVMRQVLDDPANQGKNFVASVGAAHMNTHEGGIPGIAQLFNIPGIIVDPASGKLVPQPDDPSKRAMPSKEEQAFIDRYVDELENEIKDFRDRTGDAARILQKDIYSSAKALAAKLRVDGKLANIGSVDAALQEPEVRQRFTAYTEVVKAALEPIDADKLDGFVATAIGSGSGALATLLTRHAAGRSRVDLIDQLAIAGADMTARDENGDSPMHFAVRRRRDDDPIAARNQARTVEALIINGADPNATDKDGRTAAHWSALNNNTDALELLYGRGGRFDVTDKRGWTPYEFSVGSTKVEAEEWFYGKGQPNPPGVNAVSPSLSSVDALMKAVKCEDPSHVAKVQTALTELYGNPDLRPVLDLLALDLLSPRDPRNGGGLRIYIADFDTVSGLFNDPTKNMNGAYDDGAHVSMVGANSSADFAGCLIHELTHAAARVAYGNNTQPFPNGQKDAYRQAATDDVRATTLLWPGDQKEDAVKDRISGRMDFYVLRYGDEAELKLMQEFVVSVPQLMAEFGSAETAKLAPNLTQYFRGPFAAACAAAANDPRFAAARGKLDNTNLIATAQPRQPAPPTRIVPRADTPDRIVSMVRDNYLAAHGGPTGDPAKTPYKPDQLGMVNHQQWAFDARMQRVEKMLRKVLAEQGLPGELMADGLRDLAKAMDTQIQAATLVKDIDEPARALALNWVREAKVEYAIKRRSDGVLPDDRALAEAIVIEAENLAWNNPPVISTVPVAVEVDPTRHQKMIDDLAVALGNASNKQRANPRQLLTTLAAALAGDKNRGFYRKVDRGGISAQHVSISGKNAKRVWMEELKAA